MSKNEVLAERLHAARLFAGLSVNELMDAGIKVLKQTYSAYETGAAKINKKYLPAVVRALNVNEDYLIGGGHLVMNLPEGAPGERRCHHPQQLYHFKHRTKRSAMVVWF